jgi:hypothetical protein
MKVDMSVSGTAYINVHTDDEQLTYTNDEVDMTVSGTYIDVHTDDEMYT